MTNMNSIQWLIIFLTIGIAQKGFSQIESENVQDIAGGLSFNDGVFYPTHSIQGMVYNEETKSYENPPTGPNLPDSTPLLSAYSTASNKRVYLGTLTSAEKASMALASDGEQANEILKTITVPFDDWNTSDPDYSAKLTQARLDLEGLLRALPSNEVANVINKMIPFEGAVFPGAPWYYGKNNWNTVQGVNLSGLNLQGVSFLGHNMAGVNLAGTTGITGAQMEASGYRSSSSSPMYYSQANLSGLNLVGFVTSGRAFSNVNFVGSTLNGTQAMQAGDISTANLSGLNMTGATGFNSTLRGVNFQNATGLTAEAIASSLRIANYPGETIPHLNLRGTGITKAALDAAIAAAGNSGQNVGLGSMDTSNILFD